MISALTHQGLACHRLREASWHGAVEEHPWWSTYELSAVLGATTFNKQARSGLDTRTEHLRESVA